MSTTGSPIPLAHLNMTAADGLSEVQARAIWRAVAEARAAVTLWGQGQGSTLAPSRVTSERARLGSREPKAGITVRTGLPRPPASADGVRLADGCNGWRRE